MLKADADIFQQIGELSDDIYFIFDVSRNKFQYISPALSTIWGLSPDQVISDPAILVKSIHPDDMSHVISSYEAVLSSDNKRKLDFKILHKDRQEKFISITLYPIQQENKKGIFAGIVRDITTL